MTRNEMMKMRVSIIGAGRNRNGIGEYIGKYFHAFGAEVTSVLGTTEKTSQEAAVGLRKYGIVCHSLHRFLTDGGEGEA